MTTLQYFSAFRRGDPIPPLHKPKPTQNHQSASASSLVKDKGAQSDWPAKMLPPIISPFEAMNYLRPSNQLVLLLQKGVDFPVYPPELAECIDDRTWYKRMEELEKALSRYWSWVEKALFAFAFVASVTVPWPVISAVSSLVQSDEGIIYDEDDNDFLSNSASAAASAISYAATSVQEAVTTSLPSNTVSSAARAVTATATNLVRRQAVRTNESTGIIEEEMITGKHGEDYAEWPGYESWADGYSSGARWAGIGILIGVVIAVWLPWLIFTLRNSRRLRHLITAWNAEDAQLGPMKALTWSLDKAPAFSNAKFLIIGLPPSLHQQASVFHENAYPPVYGNAGPMQANGLPDYHDQGYHFRADDKESWYVPPQAVAEQKVHVAPESNAISNPEEQLHRINSARHSLSSSRRGSLISNGGYGSGIDGVTRAYGADASNGRTDPDRRALDTVSPYETAVNVDNVEGGITRPQRSSSRSSRHGARAL